MRTNHVYLMIRLEDMPLTTPSQLKEALCRVSKGSVRCNLMTTLPGLSEDSIKVLRIIIYGWAYNYNAVIIVDKTQECNPKKMSVNWNFQFQGSKICSTSI